VRFAAIADWADSGAYPVSFMCTWLGVSRSGYYAWRAAGPSQRSRDDSALTAVMKKIYADARGNPGVRRMRAGLEALGHLVSHKRVHRLMQAAGLRGRHPRAWKRTTIGGDRPVPAPDLVGRDFTAGRPGEKWCGDVTYIKTWDGWAYLATVIDLHSRKVIGWAVAAHMRTSLVVAALDMAIAVRKPPAGVIFHSDRGCQYTSSVFDEYCTENNIRRSLGRTGICYDNAVSESFFATYKKELIHTRPWATLSSLEKETSDWIGNYYNPVRRHSTLGYLTPNEYELGYRQLSQLAA
jgi:putative transposase